MGFKDGKNTGPDYLYDGNLNIIHDYNKAIAITYNRLNLPVMIDSGNKKVQYYYNFLGEKYKKVLSSGGVVVSTRYYLDEIEYSRSSIDFVHTAEGRAIKNGTSYYYEYALADQTGSTRVTFADRGNNGVISTEQINAYYPYGLQYQDPSQTRITSPSNLYTYEGNETQQDLNINLSDFNARQYDPALGRFLSHDPDDQFADLSPYAAFGNNPINNVDPSGRSFFDLAVGLAGLGAVIGGIADGSSSGKGFFAGLAAGFIAGIVGREGIGGITSIGLNLGTGGYNDLGSSKGFFGKTQKTLGDLAGKAENLAPKGPGNPFSTITKAAKDFESNYNDNSIKDGREFGTVIYQLDNGQYTYTPPVEGETAGVYPQFADPGPIYKKVGYAHTHGNYDKSLGNGNDVFSPADINFAKFLHAPNYVGTPNGSFQVVDQNGNITNISNDLPSDPTDPTRRNTINPFKLPKNEPIYNIWHFIKFHILLPIGFGASAVKN